jgi:predicted dehydrogenase
VPDTFFTTIDYPTNHSVVLAASQVTQARFPETIRGQKATITYGAEREAEKRTILIAPEEPFQDEVKAQTLEFDAEPRDYYPHMRNFLDCLRSRKECNLNAQNGYKVMVAIGLCVKAYRENKAMLFDPEKEKVMV